MLLGEKIGAEDTNVSVFSILLIPKATGMVKSPGGENAEEKTCLKTKPWKMGTVKVKAGKQDKAKTERHSHKAKISALQKDWELCQNERKVTD